jgi:hypothetical protein
MEIECGTCKKTFKTDEDDQCPNCWDNEKDIPKSLGDSDKIKDDFYEREKYPNKLKTYEPIQRESIR